MNKEKIDKYNKIIPNELKTLLNDAPSGNLEWTIFMYLLSNFGRGNIITLGKISKFFDIDEELVFEILNKSSPMWIKQYMNSGYDKIYYTYEVTDISADLMVKLIELLEIPAR